jgi:hypothetical protein
MMMMMRSSDMHDEEKLYKLVPRACVKMKSEREREVWKTNKKRDVINNRGRRWAVVAC